MRRPVLVLAALAAFLAPALAQTRAAPESRAQVQLSFAGVVKQASPAVVNVYGARVERRPNQAMDDFFRRYFGEGQPGGMPQDRVQRSLGSGVIVDPTGLVVTNNHVIENMTEVKVALADRREFEAEIVLRDPRTDLAVLRLKGGQTFPALAFGDSEELEVGDLVLAIGNPFGVGQTVTQGIVSALARTQVGVTDYQFFIQTDAAINPGNSGGALVDMAGQLVGINTAIFSRSGGSHGIGFAIPASMVRTVVDSAKGGGRTVRRPWLGARLQAVNPEIADSVGLERPTGVLVAAVSEKSPAEEAGIRRGDVILDVDGRAVDDPESFGYRFALKGVEGRTAMTVMRGGKRNVVQVRLSQAPETRPREPVRIRSRSPLSGATAVNMSPAVAEELSIETGTEGVVLQEVERGSAAARVGFQPGDIILAINGERVVASRDLDRVMRDGRGLWEITINRGGRVFTTVLGG
ncbi:MAG TPA: DegQ family serine endoprotease [Salinarimonas sp.]|jgi:Do/DeqQ family serine protease|nr:DegQ family serine endoprotease [Salinarimonas sp.]